jgi:predicted NAD/FAD-dependent oxidoreductase
MDVAIVAAGIAGLYAAWRLAMAGGKRIHLFEASDRLGGRIHTLHPAPGLTVELGAQSIRDDHALLLRLLRLLRHLDVATTGVQDEAKGWCTCVAGPDRLAKSARRAGGVPLPMTPRASASACHNR